MKSINPLIRLSLQSALIIALTAPLTCDPEVRLHHQLLPLAEVKYTVRNSDKSQQTPLISFVTNEGCNM